MKLGEISSTLAHAEPTDEGQLERGSEEVDAEI
jgi:hypothetical protein